MANYEKTKELLKETKKYYFGVLAELDYSEIDDETASMLKNSMTLVDKVFDLALSLAKQNDEMSERLINIESKLDAVLARMNQ